MITSRCAITRLFLRNGCDIQENFPINLGEHPFLTSQEEHPESSEELIWQNESHHMRIWLDFLRDQNIDVDYPDHADHNDLTLLHTILLLQRRGPTSYQGSTEAVFMLCAMGANVSARTFSNGAQPLHLICWTPYSSEKAFHIRAQFEILLNFGADPCARDGDGLTVTQIACSSGWEEQWFLLEYMTILW